MSRPNYGPGIKAIAFFDAETAKVDEALRLCIKHMSFPGTPAQQNARAMATQARKILSKLEVRK